MNQRSRKTLKKSLKLFQITPTLLSFLGKAIICRQKIQKAEK